MRIVLVLIIALATSVGCAKKSKPAAAPTAPEMKEAAPGGAADSSDDADETKGGSETKGDPCDGGETKSK